MNLLDSVLPQDMATAILEFDAGMARFPICFAEGYQHFTVAARLGHPGGLYMVGKCHMYSHGVAQNNKVAEAYLSAAFQRGHNRAGYILGIFHHRQKDPLTGNGYFIKAADLGEFDSQLTLGTSYETGTDHLPQSRSKALHYYLMAARNPYGRPKDAIIAVKRLDRALWTKEFATRTPANASHMADA